MELISSLQNQKIKDLVTLETKSRERRMRGIFAVEGRREIERALASGFQAVGIFCTNESKVPQNTDCPVYEVTDKVYTKIAYREGTEGIIAVMKEKNTAPEDLSLTANSLILVLESVEKPGNLGAVLRTADAAGVDAVFICDPLTDLYNPNLIRASLGAIFSVPTVCCTSQEAFSVIKSAGIRILTAQLQDSELYYDTDMTCGTALVFGTEDKGLTDFWRERSDAKIRIPMAGMMDSLNVSVSAAILCFEAVRQRNIISE
ncbi:MAG: RNA methyltransferase [Bacteroidales bacterium]|nr:RNA methyltransferase [Candidatus Cacconaster scatequi]